MQKPKQNKNNDSIWVMFAWGLNILGIVAILLVVLAYFYLQNVSAAPQTTRPIYTITVPPTYTQDPASIWLPTITPNPRSTMIVVQTPTPFVIENFGSFSHV